MELTMLTDSQSHSKILVKALVTTETSLLRDGRAAREYYKMGAISDIPWIRSQHNIVEWLTKLTICPVLGYFLYQVTLDLLIEPWVNLGAFVNE